MSQRDACQRFCLLGQVATPLIFVGAAIGGLGQGSWVTGVGMVLLVLSLVAVVVAVVGAIVADAINPY